MIITELVEIILTPIFEEYIGHINDDCNDITGIIRISSKFYIKYTIPWNTRQYVNVTICDRNRSEISTYNKIELSSHLQKFIIEYI